MDADDTLPSIAGLAPATLQSPELGTRYDLMSLLGRGGMGEVRLARDRRIGREVAVKLMRSELRDDAAMMRFFREAHVQGFLDHPSIVPIHDLGVDPDGNPFFVMKRVSGTTLAEVLDGARSASERWSRRLLLTRFVDVCFAIDYAHSRRVIHRDLKPSNIMFGDFGETYVLDWGLARMLASRASVAHIETAGGEHGTQAGDLLGTPGYMSPEQARGEIVDTATDVYALGCVLFEILVGKPALPRGVEAIAATLAKAHHRPSEHAEVAPELDDLCVRATDADASRRPSARELADGIQAHLEGDRDLARRSSLAEEHARSASKAEAEAPTDESRATAMREAGRALALDPANATAQRILGGLMLTAPRAIPAEAIASADEERGRTRQEVLRMAGGGYLLMIVAVFVLMQLPMNQQWLLGATAGLALVTGSVALMMSRWLMPMRSPWFILLLVLNCALITMSGILFTPLLVMPIFLIGSLTGWLQQPTAYSPWIVVVVHIVPFIALLVLEWLGVLPSTFHIVAGDLVVTPWVVELTPAVTLVIFAVTFVAQAVTSVTVMLKNRYSQQAAQDLQHANAWHLRQLLPRARG